MRRVPRNAAVPTLLALLFAVALVLGPATRAEAVRYKLAHTYTGAPGADSFGRAIAADDERVLIGAPYDSVDGHPVAGAVHVFDATTGTFVRTLVSPAAGGNAFGIAVAAAGEIIVVGEAAGNGPGESRGVVHFFDADTGAHVRAIVSPNADPESRGFGSSLTVAGTRLLVGTPSTTTYMAPAEELYVLELPSGDLVDTLEQPAGGHLVGFGEDAVESGDAIVVGNWQHTPDHTPIGIAYVFNAASGDFVRALENPDPLLVQGFGAALAPLGGASAVGATSFTDSQFPFGAVFVMDLADGGLIRTILPPPSEPKRLLRFGTSLANVGDLLLVGAPALQPPLPGSAAYLFDPATGTLVADFKKFFTFGFGAKVASRGTDVLVAAEIPADDTGAVFHYVVTCGDGVLDACETCDDGNTTAGDGCDASCTVETCGDGTVDAGEECDDGNAVDGDGCDAGCLTTACGNCVVTAGEACDDGNTSLEDDCDPNCTVPTCGNGVVGPIEGCDDANTLGGDGCSAGCRVEQCGNQWVDAGESCDDGNHVDGDGCAANCRLERRRLEWWKHAFTAPDPAMAVIRHVLLAPAGILMGHYDGNDDERYRLFSRDDGTLLHAFPESTAHHAAVVGDDIAIAAAGSPAQVNLYDGQSLALIRSYVDPAPGFGFGYSTALVGDHLLVQDLADGVHVFEAATGAYLRTIPRVATDEAFDFGATIAALGAGAHALVSGTSGAYVFDLATGALVRTLTGPNGEAVIGPHFVAIDHRVLFPTKDGPVHVVDATTGDLLDTFTAGVPRFVHLGASVARLGDELYIGASDALHVFDAATYAFRRAIRNPEPDGCFGHLAPLMTPFGLAVSDVCYGESFDGIVHLLDPATGERLAVLPGMGGGSSEQHFHAVGTYGTTILAWSQGDESGEDAVIEAWRPCADGVLEPGEECDDGNFVSGDGCDLSCTVTRCGNGIVTAGEKCDAGSLTPVDDCLPDCTRPVGMCEGGAAIDRPRLFIRNVGSPPGNATLVVSGYVPTPAGGTAGSPAAVGAQILIADATGAALFDLTAATTPIPPGPRGQHPCDRRDGWRASRSHDVYVNRSGALDAVCTPGSARGLKRLTFERQRYTTRSRFLVRAGGASLPPFTGPLRVTVIIGTDAVDGLEGRCATHTFAELDCRLNAPGTSLRCR